MSPMVKSVYHAPRAPVARGKMTLGAVSRGRLERPQRVVLYGVEGVGKSTFGANAPSPIFLCSEDGTAQLDVARFPDPADWIDVLEAVRTLTTEPHEYKTLVLDTLDHLEPMAWMKVCVDGGKGGIDDFPFGKGYAAAVEVWRGLMKALEELQRARGMHVILLAHAHVKRMNDPAAGEIDRYRMKMHEKSADFIKEWAETVLFARHELFVTTVKNQRSKGLYNGARVIHTTWSAAYDAKNRYALPETLPLDWDAFFASTRSVERLRAAIDALAERLPEEDRGNLPKALAWAGDAPDKLSQLLEKMRGKVPPTEENETDDH